jgi:aminodeoxychorismate synthase component I
MLKHPLRRAISLDGLGPIDVAARLRHLPGLVFFDSAGNLPFGGNSAISVIAARPVELHTGSIHHGQDRAGLRDALHGLPDAPGDIGFPSGGLCGWVEYDGAFCFGVYPEMLVFQHRDESWWETGDLSGELRDPSDEAVSLTGFVALTQRSDFLAGVENIKRYIAAGDIYQVNLTQAFEAEATGGSLFGLYETLRDLSPAPMAAWLSLADREVLSSSPETFLRFSGRRVETRPIKGTRPRFPHPDDDLRSAYELQTSPKEIAELVMITDLLRNDLGQVCEFGSVEVADLLRLESLAQVHHLVSTVQGTLRPDCDALDALAACFPGGSITGAPKKRAMEIITELEPQPRGLYCGAIGYLGRNGESCFNIAIRTLVRDGSRVRYNVGAGIVADSDAAMEYEETLHKAAGIRRAIEHWHRQAACLAPPAPLPHLPTPP